MSNKYLEKIAETFKEDRDRTGARGALQAVGGGLVGDFAARKLGFKSIGRTVGTVIGAVHGGVAGVSASRDNQRREHYSSEILKNKAEQSGYHTQIMKHKAELSKQAEFFTNLEKKAKEFKEDRSRTVQGAAIGSVVGGGVGSLAAAASRSKGLSMAGLVAGGAAYGAFHGSRASVGNQKKEHFSRNYSDKVLLKQAELSSQAKKDIASTATIGAAGAITNSIADAILHPNAPKGSGYKAALLGGGLGLVGDYGAVKLNNLIAKKIED